MQSNFTTFNDQATEIKTKQVNGLTLVWSEQDKRFMVPMPEPEKAGTKILWDDDANVFFQITITNPSFVYRDRTATSPDGTTIQERILIGRDKTGEQIEIPDPDFLKTLILSKKLQLQKQILESAQSWFAMFFFGVAVAIVVFFWNLVSSVGVVASSFATGSTLAMSEVGYYLSWGVGLIVGGFLLKFLVPLLFRSSIGAFGTTGGNITEPEQTQQPITNINVTHIQGNGGSTASTAQDFINNRTL